MLKNINSSAQSFGDRICLTTDVINFATAMRSFKVHRVGTNTERRQYRRTQPMYLFDRLMVPRYFSTWR